jgi:hypothetical protein
MFTYEQVVRYLELLERIAVALETIAGSRAPDHQPWRELIGEAAAQALGEIHGPQA